MATTSATRSRSRGCAPIPAACSPITALTPRSPVTVKIVFRDGTVKEAVTRCRIDTINELDYYRHGGILHYVLRNLVAA